VSSLLTYLRPLRYDRVRDVVLVQTGEAALLDGIVAELRRLFPGSSVKVLLREADAARARALAVEEVEVARWEGRYELLSRLRRRRIDAVVLQLGGAGTTELRLLPYLLRTRYLIAFNERLDYFPVNIFRLTSLAHHFSVAGGDAGIARSSFWALRRILAGALVGVVSFAYLLASVGWLHVRGWLRRRGRGRAARRAVRAGASVA
jgi:hypothetical protein